MLHSHVHLEWIICLRFNDQFHDQFHFTIIYFHLVWWLSEGFKSFCVDVKLETKLPVSVNRCMFVCISPVIVYIELHVNPVVSFS